MGKKEERKTMPAINYKRVYDNGVLVAYESNIGRIEKYGKGYFIPSFVGTDIQPYYIKLSKAQAALKEEYRIANNIPYRVYRTYKTGLLLRFKFHGKTYTRRVYKWDWVIKQFFIKVEGWRIDINGIERCPYPCVMNDVEVLEGDWEKENEEYFTEEMKRKAVWKVGSGNE